MDASAHRLHTIGVTDNAGDVPVSVRANVATAEQLALNRLFGIDLPTTNNEQVGAQISARIFSIVRNVYTSLDQAGLADQISSNVREALRQAEPANTLALNDQRRIHAVAKAVYESIPQDLLERFTLVTLPARISMDNRGVPSGVVEVRNVMIDGVPRTLTINTDIPFWKLNDKSRSTEDDIRASILGTPATPRTPESIGILTGIPALPAGYILTAADAAALAAANDVRLTEKPEGVGKCEYDYGTATPRAKINVNTDKMMAESTDSDAPRGLQNRPIYSFSADELRDLLEHRGKDGSYPYWKKYVSGGPANPFDTLEDLVCNYPTLTPPVVIAAAGVPIRSSEAVSEIVRVIHQAPTRTDTIGTRQVTLVDAQRDVHRKLDENRAFIDRLRTGSENPQGAIVAASIALNDPGIYASVSESADQVKLQTDLNQARAKLELAKHLQSLKDLKMNLKMSALPSGAAAHYASIEAESQNLARDIAGIGSATNWVSDFCLHNFVTTPPNTITNTADKRDMASRLQPQAQALREELAQYDAFGDLLKRVAQTAQAGGIFANSPILAGFISNTGVLTKASILASTNNIERAEAIRGELKIDTEDDIKSTITKLEEQLKKAKNSGDKGDVLQQKIFEAHFRNQGHSSQEAQRSANYLYAKSLVDSELRGQIDALHDDLFVHHEIGRTALDNLNPAEALRKRKDWTVTGNIARCVGLPPRYVPNSIIPFQGVTHHDWQTRSYQQLISAYYSFKKLYEGGGPEYINSPGSTVYLGQMREIARALSDRHVMMIMNDFGNDLPDKDRADLASRKTLSLEIMEKMLTGDAPEKYKNRIDHILAVVDGGTHRYRRGVYGAVNGLGTLGGNALGVTTSMAKGSANLTKNVGVGLWNQKKNIMGFAALTALGGPVGAAVFLGYKMWNAPTISTGGGGHH